MKKCTDLAHDPDIVEVPPVPRKQAKGRKTIQICSSLDSVGKYLILAVCDDGTIWQLTNLYLEDLKKDVYWEPFPTPPET